MRQASSTPAVARARADDHHGGAGRAAGRAAQARLTPTGGDRSSCQPIQLNPQLALVVELLAYGGLRVGEALALRRKHVDVLGCKLVVAESLTELNDVFTFGPTKTHQVREVPLP